MSTVLLQQTTTQKNMVRHRVNSCSTHALFSLAVVGWVCLQQAVMTIVRSANTIPPPAQMDLPKKWRIASRKLQAKIPSKWEVAPIHHDSKKKSRRRQGEEHAQSDEPEKGSRFSQLYKKTNATMSACLLVNDDTIKLTEWMAYHYTVLPLSHLIVAIDPHSQLEKQIRAVLEPWQERLQFLDIWSHDSWMTLNATEGWRQSIFMADNVTLQPWFLDQNKTVRGRFHAHNRRQQHFATQCMRKLKALNQTWVLHLDTDEFLLYNYLGSGEDANNFEFARKREDEALQAQFEESLRNLRAKVLPIRRKLPALSQVTIADFLHHFRTGPCMPVPGLQISARESTLAQVQKDVPPFIDGRKLLSLRHRKHGKKTGKFTKAIIDVSKVDWELLVKEQMVTIHTPIRDACPSAGHASGSGYDYQSSILRLHHFAGTYRAFAERQNDGRRTRLYQFNTRDVQPEGETDELRPWIKAFVEKVGEQSAKELLSPLDRAYQQRDLDPVV